MAEYDDGAASARLRDAEASARWRADQMPVDALKIDRSFTGGAAPGVAVP